MPLKFSANLDTLFKEYPVVDRFRRASEFGFRAFEMQNPYVLAPEVISENSAGLKLDLINSYCVPIVGDPDAPDTDHGYAANPDKEQQFYTSVQKPMEYFYKLSFKKLHILTGKNLENHSPERQLETIVERLKNLIACEFFENIEIIGLFEPICADVLPNYYLNSFDLAVDIIKAIGGNQVKLLLDVYHLHKITGDVKANLGKFYEHAGHIQVSQDPGRREPFHEGNIDYNYVFDFLRQAGHDDYIGLEYFPSGSTEESLRWMNDL